MVEFMILTLHIHLYPRPHPHPHPHPYLHLYLHLHLHPHLLQYRLEMCTGMAVSHHHTGTKFRHHSGQCRTSSSPRERRRLNKTNSSAPTTAGSMSYSVKTL